MMKSFELQIYKAGQWIIHGIFNDPDMALFEANRCIQGNRFVGVRVIEETYSETLDQSRARTIFSGGQGVEIDKAGLEQQMAIHINRQRFLKQYDGRQSPEPRDQEKNKCRLFGWITPLILLALLVLLGLAAMVGLQYYFLPHQHLIFKL